MDRPLVQTPDPPQAAVQVPQPGDVIEGKYRIEKVLGEGGMGVVLAAHHELLDQRVAVKVLTSSDPKAMSRFSLEAKATAQLKSEHVARIMDVGVLPSGAPFIVMEYLEGCDLGELLRLNKRLPIEETVGYVLDAIDGLAQAHALEIVHRDLKPANLFLAVQRSGASIVKLVDFGISKSIASRRSGKTGVLTGDHSTVGSPTYMAPEQIRSPKDVDARADIWAIGVVLYELLSGAAPFQGDSVGEIFAAVLELVPPPLTSVVPEVPAGLSAVIARCMSELGQRYPDVLTLAKDLAPFGPPDSLARVARIEQTVLAMKAKAAGVDVARGTGRITLPMGAPTVDAESGPAVPGQGTARHAFATDTASVEERRSATSPSLRRQAGRRKAAKVGGVIAATLLVAGVAFLKTRAPVPVGSVGAQPPAPSAMPLPAPTLPAPAPTASPASSVPAFAVDSLPTARPHGPATGGAPAPRKPSPTPRHYKVLDSPD